MNTKPSYNITPTAVVVMVGNRDYTVNKGDERYAEVRQAIQDDNFSIIPDLLDLKGRLVSDSNGGIYLLNGMLRCDKYDIPALLATRIVQMLREKFSIKPLTLFLENLMSNPNESGTIVEELYGFIEGGNLPITADGHFLAYKMVNQDFTDCRTGSMDNSVGAIVEMERSDCCFDREQTCSTGLHFCSREYMGSGMYGQSSSQLVVVKVNPRDVTSIPTDYNKSKGRACLYEIVDAIDWEDLITPLFTTEHSEDIDDPAQDEPTETRWELRDNSDGSLVNTFVTRQGARDARSGNASLYIVDTETGEVVAGVEPATPEEVEYDTSAEDDTSVKTNPSAVLNEKLVSQIRKIIKQGAYETLEQLALMFGVSARTIGRIRDGKSWTHVK